MEIKGAIFDMDGTLLDTEKLYTKFWAQAAVDCGYDMKPEDALSLRSLGKNDTIAKFKSFFGDLFKYDPVYNRRVELMEKFIEENGVELKKGAAEILTYLKENGYKIALATSSPYERAVKQLSSVGILGFFDGFACGPMVKKGKPAPDIYLLAAKKIGLQPHQCIAVEDSPTGIMSAKNAGCKPVLVPDLDEPDPQIRELLFACCESLDKIRDILV